MTKRNTLFPAIAALGLCLSSISNAQPTNTPFKIQVYEPVGVDTSPPLRDIGPPHKPSARWHRPLLRPGVVSGGSSVADPVAQVSATAPSAATSPNNFEGIPATLFPCPTPEDPNRECVAAPPDENIAVGPNHIFQTVNVHYAIWDKTGNLLLGPTPNNAIWAGYGGPCETHNDGDPIVRYDQIADRWLFTQLAADTATSNFYECIAVSTSEDPTGSYYRYAFNFGFRFQDYPKFGVWPDGYYMSANSFILGFLYEGSNLCAFDRSKMLIGAPAVGICVMTGSLYSSQLPSDLDGPTLPPSNTPNAFVGLYTTDPGYLAMFRMKPNFVNTSATQVTGPFYISVSPFNLPCGNGGDCIPQLGTTQLLSSLGDRLMHRLAYRNFGAHQSLVLNHSVAANNTVGTRWYEIRDPNGTPVVYQEGTYTPDSNDRWMGSIAMDKSGGIGLGYSKSGPGIYPGIFFAGREAGDPVGELSAEQLVWAGGGSQDGLNRWGDYSSMEVDPTDDCTFWYTSQYLPATGSFNWRTRIASFKFSSCGGSPPPPPTGVPAAPSNLTATAIYSGNGKNKQFQHVSLGWSDNSDNEQQFVIERCEVIGKGKNATCTFGEISSVGANVTSYDDSSPTKGKYRYHVQATNAGGGSDYSNEAEVSVQ